MTAYGIEWAGGTSPNASARLQTGAALTIPADAAAITAFNGYAPWSGMKRVNLSNAGIVTATNGTDSCFTDVEVTNMGQTMVTIPKFWYSVDITGAPHIRYYISSTGTEVIARHDASGNITWAVHPAFIRNGVTKAQIYLGAYEAYYNALSTYLESKVGVQPTTTVPPTNFRTAAQSRGIDAHGIGWGLQDFLATTAVQLLALIEYGTFDFQTVLSAGITNMPLESHNAASLCGHTGSLYTDLGNASGSVTHVNEHTAGEGAGITTYAMSYRGIENFYGNTLTMLEGIKLNTNSVWIADHDFDNVNAPADPYIDSGVDWGLGAATGPISEFDYSVAAYKYAFIPKTTTGTDFATYACDTNIQASVTTDVPPVPYTTIPTFGGWWKSSWGGGMFCWDANFITPPLTYAGYYAVGVRLMYMG